MIRYSAGYLVAEDDRGGLLAAIGPPPQILPEEVPQELVAIQEEAILSVGMPIAELPKGPEPCSIGFYRVLQAEVPYAVWKISVDPTMYIRGEPEEIKSEWEDLRARYNTLEIDYITMGVRSRIKTSRFACNGFIWHFNMEYGSHYARDTWNVQPNYWWRWSLRPL